jgi:hypothetical protein
VDGSERGIPGALPNEPSWIVGAFRGGPFGILSTPSASPTIPARFGRVSADPNAVGDYQVTTLWSQPSTTLWLRGVSLKIAGNQLATLSGFTPAERSHGSSVSLLTTQGTRSAEVPLSGIAGKFAVDDFMRVFRIRVSGYSGAEQVGTL